MKTIYRNEKVQVFRATCELFKSHSYFIKILTTGRLYVIDCIISKEKIHAAMDFFKCKIDAVICTHGHFDHIGCADFIQKKEGCKVFISDLDIGLTQKANFLLMVCGSQERISLPDFTSTLAFECDDVYILETPGHTKGSICIGYENLLFTGDTLFSKSIAKSKLPGENLSDLQNSVRYLFKHFDKETLIFPGHGPSSKLRKILQENKDLIQLIEK